MEGKLAPRAVERAAAAKQHCAQPMPTEQRSAAAKTSAQSSAQREVIAQSSAEDAIALRSSALLGVEEATTMGKPCKVADKYQEFLAEAHWPSLGRMWQRCWRPSARELAGSPQKRCFGCKECLEGLALFGNLMRRARRGDAVRGRTMCKGVSTQWEKRNPLRTWQSSSRRRGSMCRWEQSSAQPHPHWPSLWRMWQRCWRPRARELADSSRKRCFGCKKCLEGLFSFANLICRARRGDAVRGLTM